MKKTLLSIVVGISMSASAFAQDPIEGRPPLPPSRPQVPTIVPQNLPTNPPTAQWNPQQDYERYDSPRKAVQRKAAWKAAQRRQRIEAMKWMGYSPSRPPTSAVPWMGSSAPYAYGPYILAYPAVAFPRTTGYIPFN